MGKTLEGKGIFCSHTTLTKYRTVTFFQMISFTKQKQKSSFSSRNKVDDAFKTEQVDKGISNPEQNEKHTHCNEAYNGDITQTKF